jgi:hypothetical protein
MIEITKKTSAHFKRDMVGFLSADQIAIGAFCSILQPGAAARIPAISPHARAWRVDDAGRRVRPGIPRQRRGLSAVLANIDKTGGRLGQKPWTCWRKVDRPRVIPQFEV